VTKVITKENVDKKSWAFLKPTRGWSPPLTSF